MASYTYASYGVYSNGAQSFPPFPPFTDRQLMGASDENGTVQDAEMDSSFELGPPADTVTINVNPDGSGNQMIVVTYVGQTSINGFPVLVFEGTGSFFGNPLDFFVVAAPVIQGASFQYPNPLPAEATSSFTVCFGAGTKIATPQGETSVEALTIGDMVQTEGGQAVPVKWVGRQTLHKLFVGANMQPVRIRAGGLGNGLPHSDLTVTADHGMILNNHVINASALVNGDTIDFVPMADLDDSFTVYHIETEDHDVILANGAPSETFIDAASRANFDNHQEYLDLYGAERIIPEMQMPRITSQRLVPTHLKQSLGIAEPMDIRLVG